MNIFDVRTMLDAVQTQQEKGALKLFLRKFFKSQEPIPTFEYEIDRETKGKRVAPCVSRIQGGKVVDKEGFQTLAGKLPTFKPKMVDVAEEMFKRQAGESPYSGKTPQERSLDKLADELVELGQMHDRREEMMSAMALTTGKVLCKGEGFDETYDFQMLPTHLVQLAGNARWSESTTSKPLANLRAWSRLISNDSNGAADTAILGTGALDMFLDSVDVRGTGAVRGLFDSERIDLGNIDPRTMPGGVVYLGYVKELGISLYSYNQKYFSEIENAEVPYIPSNSVVVFDSRADLRFLYGPINDFNSLVPVPRFPRSWTPEEGNLRYVSVESACLAAPLDINAIVSAKVA